MKYIVQALVLAAIAILSAPSLGTTYSDTIRGTKYDPLVVSKNTIGLDEFKATLNGPQKPAVYFNADGRNLLVYETCMEMLCPEQHAVIAIDQDTDEVFAAVYTLEGLTHILIPAPFGATVNHQCAKIGCQIDPVQKGPLIKLQALSRDDLSTLAGGAFCEYRDLGGNIVLYTEGEGRVFWDGKLRKLTEQGIGTDALYTADDLKPLKIEVAGVENHQTAYESNSYTAVLNILDEREFRWYSSNVKVYCET